MKKKELLLFTVYFIISYFIIFVLKEMLFSKELSDSWISFLASFIPPLCAILSSIGAKDKSLPIDFTRMIIISVVLIIASIVFIFVFNTNTIDLVGVVLIIIYLLFYYTILKLKKNHQLADVGLANFSNINLKSFLLVSLLTVALNIIFNSIFITGNNPFIIKELSNIPTLLMQFIVSIPILFLNIFLLEFAFRFYLQKKVLNNFSVISSIIIITFMSIFWQMFNISSIDFKEEIVLLLISIPFYFTITSLAYYVYKKYNNLLYPIIIQFSSLLYFILFESINKSIDTMSIVGLIGSTILYAIISINLLQKIKKLNNH
ncbi:type II CAAX prenyl endopeptidase Rce1 family protein [Mycoplasma sp. P36-A1]|uniref:CPBP family glutamic-type intramembrane protease n=1 Tax=Mycoplasma sp. P36-A1 TaxID=3252900 RepID=UPI003C2F0254